MKQSYEILNIEEFEQEQGNVQCRSCHSINLFTVEKPPHIELRCKDCGTHQKFLSHGKQPNRRPKLAKGTTKEVWDAYGNCCAHCGLTRQIIEDLGLQITIQHAPPFQQNGHDTNLIPLCSWCQQHSATQMKYMQALVERLAKKYAIK